MDKPQIAIWKQHLIVITDMFGLYNTLY